MSGQKSQDPINVVNCSQRFIVEKLLGKPTSPYVNNHPAVQKIEDICVILENLILFSIDCKRELTLSKFS
jgi:hypothetical protein